MNTEASAGGINAAHATAKDGLVAVSAPPAADRTRPSLHPTNRRLARLLVKVLDPFVTWLMHVEARAERYGEGR